MNWFFGLFISLGITIVIVLIVKEKETSGPSTQCVMTWNLEKQISTMPPPIDSIDAARRESIRMMAGECRQTPGMIWF
jgi:hypothetical protein